MNDELLNDISAYADGELSAERIAALEEKLRSDGALRREIAIFRKLDEAAAAIPVPDVDAKLKAMWNDKAIRKVEQVAAEIKVPAVSDARFAECWNGIAERLAQAPLEVREELIAAPEVSKQRWDTVWTKISARMTQREEKPAVAAKIPPRTSNLCMPAVAVSDSPSNSVEVSESGSNIVAVDFALPQRKRRWGWAVAASAAAIALLCSLPFVLGGPSEPTAFEIPESLDERYGVQVQYLNGQKEPVVCFFLKNDDEEKVEPKVKEWHWLPD